MRKPQSTNTAISWFARVLSGLRNRHFFAIDLVAFGVTPVIALALRSDDLDYFIRLIEPLALYAMIAIVVRLVVFIPLGLYSRYWQYASIDELALIALSVVCATLLVLLAFFALLRPLGLLPSDFPRSVPFIDGLLVLLAVGGSRYSVRLLERIHQRLQNQAENGTRVVILGAGDAGAMIVREMRANPQLRLAPVAFLDDDSRKHGSHIHSVRVVGACELIREVARDYRAQQAVIAMPTASGTTIRRLMHLCQEADIPCKTIPGVFELLDGSVSVNQLRAVEITDLLRREPVMTDMLPVTRWLSGKRVLVTGAGGSIGAELCRQIAFGAPAMLVLLGHGENNLFSISHDLQKSYPNLRLQTVVTDIRNQERVRTIFCRHQPQIVFHAAAHKHVPLMEENAEDAVTNNILGTRSLLQAADDCGVEHFVFVSTDKAVNPVSVMGATKRVAELLVLESARRTGRCFVAVRFGNVLDSRGSVVPVFKRQIAQGGPVTVTHREVRRYFMTIPEAVQLVLQAATLGKGGEIFVLDMGDPIKIIDLARDLIRLSGLEEGKDIDIVFTGLRPGDKLCEELFVPGEKYGQTKHEKILVTRNGVGPGHHSNLLTAIDALVDAAQRADVVGIRRLLMEIVPDYRPADLSARRVPQGMSTLDNDPASPEIDESTAR